MNNLFMEIIKALFSEGPLGMAVLICLASMGFSLVMGWFYHRDKVITLKKQLLESKQDKYQLMTLVKSNTLSIERNTSALKGNTETLKYCIQLIQRMMQKLQV